MIQPCHATKCSSPIVHACRTDYLDEKHYPMLLGVYITLSLLTRETENSIKERVINIKYNGPPKHDSMQ